MISSEYFAIRLNDDTVFHLFAISIISTVASVVYLPFLGNGLIFDDQPFFAGPIYDLAQIPSSFAPRSFPYFTLGVTQVLIGTISAHRAVSLLLHIGCAAALYGVSLMLLRNNSSSISATNPIGKSAERDMRWVSLISACLFVAHPVAVYGAGYLVQRTIVFATLFALLSIFYFCRALREQRYADAATAALLYAAAVLSKEHAVLVPVAALAMVPIMTKDVKGSLRVTFIYIGLCIPAAVWVVIARKIIIGNPYEPDAADINTYLQGVAVLSSNFERWVLSAVTQMGLLYKYLGVWFFPDPSQISIDIRIDFQGFAFGWATLRVLGFIAWPLTSIFLLFRNQNSWRCLGAGLFYVWALFVVELSTVRFQEPFVLYRSYLWAPGFMLMFVGICRFFPTRWFIIGMVPALAACIVLAQDRLKSLASEGNAWKDAAAKLNSSTIFGAGRIFYNRGLQYVRDKRFIEAATDFSLAIQHNPDGGAIYRQRGVAYFSLHDYKKALADFDSAVKLNLDDGQAQYGRGLALEQLGETVQARQAFLKSSTLGVTTASLKLRQLSKTSTSAAE